MKNSRLILLIDNDPEFVYLIDRYSRVIDWMVIQTASVEEALAQVHRAKPAMIMLNLMIPPSGGWEVLHKIKKDPTACKIPITVYSSIPDEERAWAEGVDFCLWKPVMLEEFLAALEAANLLNPRPPFDCQSSPPLP